MKKHWATGKTTSGGDSPSTHQSLELEIQHRCQMRQFFCRLIGVLFTLPIELGGICDSMNPSRFHSPGSSSKRPPALLKHYSSLPQARSWLQPDICQPGLTQWPHLAPDFRQRPILSKFSITGRSCEGLLVVTTVRNHDRAALALRIDLLKQCFDSRI